MSAGSLSSWICFGILTVSSSGIAARQRTTSTRPLDPQKIPVLQLLQTFHTPDSFRKSATPGKTYPTYTDTKNTGFRCSEVRGAGFYADVSRQCQQYHRCDEQGRRTTFICSPGTLFNQITLTCDFWFNVDCSRAKDFYEYSNSRINHQDSLLFSSGNTSDTVEFGNVLNQRGPPAIAGSISAQIGSRSVTSRNSRLTSQPGSFGLLSQARVGASVPVSRLPNENDDETDISDANVDDRGQTGTDDLSAAPGAFSGSPGTSANPPGAGFRTPTGSFSPGRQAGPFQTSSSTGNQGFNQQSGMVRDAGLNPRTGGATVRSKGQTGTSAPGKTANGNSQMTDSSSADAEDQEEAGASDSSQNSRPLPSSSNIRPAQSSDHFGTKVQSPASPSSAGQRVGGQQSTPVVAPVNGLGNDMERGSGTAQSTPVQFQPWKPGQPQLSLGQQTDDRSSGSSTGMESDTAQAARGGQQGPASKSLAGSVQPSPLGNGSNSGSLLNPTSPTTWPVDIRSPGASPIKESQQQVVGSTSGTVSTFTGSGDLNHISVLSSAPVPTMSAPSVSLSNTSVFEPNTTENGTTSDLANGSRVSSWSSTSRNSSGSHGSFPSNGAGGDNNVTSLSKGVLPEKNASQLQTKSDQLQVTISNESSNGSSLRDVAVSKTNESLAMQNISSRPSKNEAEDYSTASTKATTLRSTTKATVPTTTTEPYFAPLVVTLPPTPDPGCIAKHLGDPQNWALCLPVYWRLPPNSTDSSIIEDVTAEDVVPATNDTAPLVMHTRSQVPDSNVNSFSSSISQSMTGKGVSIGGGTSVQNGAGSSMGQVWAGPLTLQKTAAQRPLPTASANTFPIIPGVPFAFVTTMKTTQASIESSGLSTTPMTVDQNDERESSPDTGNGDGSDQTSDETENLRNDRNSRRLDDDSGYRPNKKAAVKQNSGTEKAKQVSKSKFVWSSSGVAQKPLVTSVANYSSSSTKKSTESPVEEVGTDQYEGVLSTSSAEDAVGTVTSEPPEIPVTVGRLTGILQPGDTDESLYDAVWTPVPPGTDSLGFQAAGVQSKPTGFVTSVADYKGSVKVAGKPSGSLVTSISNYRNQPGKSQSPSDSGSQNSDNAVMLKPASAVPVAPKIPAAAGPLTGTDDAYVGVYNSIWDPVPPGTDSLKFRPSAAGKPRGTITAVADYEQYIRTVAPSPPFVTSIADYRTQPGPGGSPIDSISGTSFANIVAAEPAPSASQTKDVTQNAAKFGKPIFPGNTAVTSSTLNVNSVDSSPASGNSYDNGGPVITAKADYLVQDKASGQPRQSKAEPLNTSKLWANQPGSSAGANSSSEDGSAKGTAISGPVITSKSDYVTQNRDAVTMGTPTATLGTVVEPQNADGSIPANSGNQLITSKAEYSGKGSAPVVQHQNSVSGGKSSQSPLTVQVITACDQSASVEVQGNEMYTAMISSLKTPPGALANQTAGLVITADPGTSDPATENDPHAAVFDSVWDPVPAGTDSLTFVAKPAAPSSDSYYIYETGDKPVFIKFSKYNVVVEVRPDMTQGFVRRA